MRNPFRFNRNNNNRNATGNTNATGTSNTTGNTNATGTSNTTSNINENILNNIVNNHNGNNHNNNNNNRYSENSNVDRLVDHYTAQANTPPRQSQNNPTNYSSINYSNINENILNNIVNNHNGNNHNNNNNNNNNNRYSENSNVDRLLDHYRAQANTPPRQSQNNHTNYSNINSNYLRNNINFNDIISGIHTNEPFNYEIFRNNYMRGDNIRAARQLNFNNNFYNNLDNINNYINIESTNNNRNQHPQAGTTEPTSRISNRELERINDYLSGNTNTPYSQYLETLRNINEPHLDNNRMHRGIDVTANINNRTNIEEPAILLNNETNISRTPRTPELQNNMRLGRNQTSNNPVIIPRSVQITPNSNLRNNQNIQTQTEANETIQRREGRYTRLDETSDFYFINVLPRSIEHEGLLQVRFSEDNLLGAFNKYGVVATTPIKAVLNSLDEYHKQEMIHFVSLIILKEEFGGDSDKVKATTESLAKIFEKMTKNPDYKAKCEEIAIMHSISCVDRAMFGYIKMLVAEKAYPDADSKFSIVDSFNLEKLLLKLDRIDKFADRKVEALIEADSRFSEDIETHLKFYDALQEDLGLEFSHMVFSSCSRVTPNDIIACRNEINNVTDEDVFANLIDSKRVIDKFESVFRKIIDAGVEKLEEVYSDETTDFAEKTTKAKDLESEMKTDRIQILKDAMNKEIEKTIRVNNFSSRIMRQNSNPSTNNYRGHTI